MSLSIGIVGLPNVGKSTLFNALTRASVLASNYPFATIEPNVGIVGIPDPRLPALAGLYDSARIVPATVRFVDIAGLVRGASQGQGLGNQFLAHIRETDAICQVVRVFTDPDVSHVDGDVSPERDIETIATELMLADLQTLEKAVPRLAKEAKFAKDPERAPGGRCRGQGAAGAGRRDHPVRRRGRRRDRPGRPARAPAADGQAVPVRRSTSTTPSWVTTRCGTGWRRWSRPRSRCSSTPRPRSELAELPEEEAAELLAELGLGEPGLAQLARAGFAALGLSTFLTAGPKEARAWTIPAGATAPEAAGRDPHRLPARVHQGRDRVVRRPDGRRVDRRGPGRRARPGSRARTTSCATATWSSSASTYRQGTSVQLSGRADARAGPCLVLCAGIGGRI